MRRLDHTILEMALVGYEAQRAKLNEAMNAVRKQLGANPAVTTSEAATRPTMSAAGRKRIAAAQRLRWKKFHATHGTAKKKSGNKQKLSTARKTREWVGNRQ